ncbi:MAG TPA: hypothetical protein DCZ69_16265 [Syntrophobacteraceae bacterium]|nr:hypothetical protein [Syntrophobacteraceae bacterium]
MINPPHFFTNNCHQHLAPDRQTTIPCDSSPGPASVAYWEQLPRFTDRLHGRIIGYSIHPLQVAIPDAPNRCSRWDSAEREPSKTV